MAARVTTPAGTAHDELGVWLRAQETKDLVRFVTIGSVDDGKSTLIGRLLHDAHGLYTDQLDAVRRASLRGSTRGAESSSEIDFSLFTDGLLAEREQGITIDVAYRYFATERRKFIIADTPGHVQYTRNMATGASTADVAVILIDARLGVLPQTRRHAHIAALLGIPNVVACVNKMDLVDFDRSKFDAIVAELAAIAQQVELRGLFAIPVSALAGDNIVTASTRMPWWTGGTMLEHLETLPAGASGPAGGPTAFRMPVQLVLRPGLAYRGFAGQIVSGTVRTGDEIVALPSGKRTRVVGVDLGGKDVGVASAPMSIALRFADDIDVSRGDMLAHPGQEPKTATELDADLVWMSERPLDPGRTYLLKHTTRTVRASIAVVSSTALGDLGTTPPGPLVLNDIGRVRLSCRTPIFFDPYRDNRGTGAFILIDSVTNDTVGAGMIAGVEARARAGADGAESGPSRSQVSPHERRERLGHEGRVVRVQGPSLLAARQLAFAVERELFDRGLVAVVVERSEPSATGEAAAEACAAGGLIAVVPVDGQGQIGTFAEIAAARLIGPNAGDHAEADDFARRVAELVIANSR